MSSVSANYTMPTILDSLSSVAASGHAKSASAKANAASTSSTSSSDSSSSTGIGSTFLSLLAQELQNQDPTAPMDATAMVGQMISLNQLEQLITINQTLTGPTTAASSAAQAAAASANGSIASTPSPSMASAATSQLPFDPNTMMPLGSGNAGALAAAFNSSINAATMDLSGTINNALGGK